MSREGRAAHPSHPGDAPTFGARRGGDSRDWKEQEACELRYCSTAVSDVVPQTERGGACGERSTSREVFRRKGDAPHAWEEWSRWKQRELRKPRIEQTRSRGIYGIGRYTFGKGGEETRQNMHWAGCAHSGGGHQRRAWRVNGREK